MVQHYRVGRLSQEIQREVNDILMKRVRDPRVEGGRGGVSQQGERARAAGAGHRAHRGGRPVYQPDPGRGAGRQRGRQHGGRGPRNPFGPRVHRAAAPTVRAASAAATVR